MVFQYPEDVRPCKRLVACHIVPYSLLVACMVACRIAFVTNCQLSRVAVQVTGRLWLIHMYPVWSLAWSLIVVCKVLDLCISGGHASDWSLVASSNALVLVACMVACVELGILLEKSSGGSQIQLHQATEQAPGHLLYF